MVRIVTYFLTLLTIGGAVGSAAAASSLKNRIIVIDPGHGVINYSNAIINTGKKTDSGIVEHSLTMQIATKLGEMLKKEGAKVYYTRTPDDYWRMSYNAVEDNKARGAFANELKAHALVSVHCDWHPSRKITGVTTLYEKPNSRRLGEILQRQMVRELKAHDRTLLRDTFTILDTSEVPAVICETGFLSHRKDSRKLITPAYQTKVAKALADGLRRYFAAN